MAVRLGPWEQELLGRSSPELLREITLIRPVAAGSHVMLQEAGFKSVQRLAVGDLSGAIFAALWPAELQAQALHLYSNERARALIEAARAGGWAVRPNPHLAFWRAHPQQRLYLDTRTDLNEYVQRWEGLDRDLIGEHAPEDVRTSVWPWVLDRGYATADDRSILDEFLGILGDRPAHLRPGLHLNRWWTREEVEQRSRSVLASQVREAVNGVLQAAGEPPLPR